MSQDQELEAEDPEESNGKDNALSRIKADWKKNGKDPAAEVSKKLVEAYKKASAAVEAAEKSLKEARAKEDVTVADLAKAFGGKPLRIAGIVHEFSCRNERIFFRKKQATDIVDL